MHNGRGQKYQKWPQGKGLTAALIVLYTGLSLCSGVELQSNLPSSVAKEAVHTNKLDVWAPSKFKQTLKTVVHTKQWQKSKVLCPPSATADQITRQEIYGTKYRRT